jgi:thiamine biosynthesis lipoprotein
VSIVVNLESAGVWSATADDFEFEAMACPCVLHLAGDGDARASEHRAAAARAAVAEVRRIEAKYSRYRAGSVVSRINAAAGGAEPAVVDAETAQLLAYADSLYRLSEGLFDISSGVLRQAWNFKQPALPHPTHLDALLSLVDWRQVEWDGERVRLPRAGMQLDFGGFGKEYAADRVAALLLDRGITQGYVNLGGDIRVLGPRADGHPWRLGVQHPRQPRAVLAELPLLGGALATSGDYERYFELEGQRYCHVLNPRTGYPVRHWQSVSVAAPLCSAAGALCTIAMLFEERGLEFLAAQGEAYLVVDCQGITHRQDANFLPTP